jgi:Pet100
MAVLNSTKWKAVRSCLVRIRNHVKRCVSYVRLCCIVYEEHVVPINVYGSVRTASGQNVKLSFRCLAHQVLHPWSMAGPNLEVFKFAVYVFFPVLVFLHYGDPEWYRTNVIPVRTSRSP